MALFSKTPSYVGTVWITKEPITMELEGEDKQQVDLLIHSPSKEKAEATVGLPESFFDQAYEPTKNKDLIVAALNKTGAVLVRVVGAEEWVPLTKPKTRPAPRKRKR